MNQRTLLQTAVLFFLGAFTIALCIFATQYGCNKLMPFDPDRAVSVEVQR